MMSNRKSIAVIVAVLGLSIGAWACGGLAQQQDDRRGVGERAGEQLDRILGDVREGFRDLSAEVQSRFARVRSEVEDMGVEARVYGRIHWDKQLQDGNVAVEILEGRDIVLHGEVSDAEAKQKAKDLAESTVGVRHVIDRLTIRQPATENDSEPEPEPEEG